MCVLMGPTYPYHCDLEIQGVCMQVPVCTQEAAVLLTLFIGYNSTCLVMNCNGDGKVYRLSEFIR